MCMVVSPWLHPLCMLNIVFMKSLFFKDIDTWNHLSCNIDALVDRELLVLVKNNLIDNARTIDRIFLGTKSKETLNGRSLI